LEKKAENIWPMNMNLSFLGQIPLVQSIREGGDEGIPAMIGKDEISKEAFREV
jgi:ATP-binding protein involved in chromosome partitioning